MDRESPQDFATFYRTFAATAFRIALFEGATRDEAEDIVQESFVELWKNWEKVKAPERWLQTVCKRAVWNRSRRRESLTAWFQDTAAVEPDISIAVETRLAAEALLDKPHTVRSQAAALILGGSDLAEAVAKLRSHPEWELRGLPCTLANLRKILREGIHPPMNIDNSTGNDDVAPEVRRIRQALSMLTERQRNVFTLRLQGMKPAQIAKQLDMEPNNARVTSHNACTKIANILDLKAPYEAVDYVREHLAPTEA